jgi:hypothetical protein
VSISNFKRLLLPKTARQLEIIIRDADEPQVTVDLSEIDPQFYTRETPLLPPKPR